MKRLTCVLAVLTLAACDAPTEAEPEPGPPAAFTIVAGNGQTDTVAHLLPDSLVGRLLDAESNPIAGAVVNWTGNGTPAGAATQTSADGHARNRWQLATTAGEQSMHAVWVDPATGAPDTLGTFTATALAGPLATNLLEPGEHTSGVDTLRLDGAALIDTYGNVVDWYLAQVTSSYFHVQDPSASGTQPAWTLVADSLPPNDPVPDTFAVAAVYDADTVAMADITLTAEGQTGSILIGFTVQ